MSTPIGRVLCSLGVHTWALAPLGRVVGGLATGFGIRCETCGRCGTVRVIDALGRRVSVFKDSATGSAKGVMSVTETKEFKIDFTLGSNLTVLPEENMIVWAMRQGYLPDGQTVGKASKEDLAALKALFVTHGGKA